MSAPYDVLSVIYSLALLFAAILALWLAGSMILRNISQIRGFKDDFASKRLLILMMWLALGGLFVIPLIDLIGIVDTFVGTFVPLFAIPASQFVIAAGIEPSLFTVMRGALLLLVYGLALWLGLKGSRSWDIPIDLPIQLTPLEKIFMILVLGGLAHSAVEEIIFGVVFTGATALSFHLGSQLAGWGISWILGLLMLGLVLLIMLNRLDARLQNDNLKQ